MATRSLLSAITGFGLAAAVLTSATSGARADELSFGFSFGGGQSGVTVGVSNGTVLADWDPAHSGRDVPERRWERHNDREDWRARRWWREHNGERWDRPHRRRVVEVCEPVWRTKRIYDDWGNVRKVVRVRSEECRLIRR
ncbi:hypothetical protein [Chthonobacter albigriseus]|uniref:hypothetical protein n=1 Tax=Chthonobacter albigriseus TaxID=1683161 RepID=UPI0015EEA196|nr:hypothetical protein [Chthonobacter albigriseus]